MALLLSLNSFSQEHMKFKGVEIDGTVEELSKKLIGVGFVKSSEERVFDGSFAGDDDCMILIITTPNGLPYSIAVSRSDKDTWRSLKSDYENMKESYIKKYGKPSLDIHRFESPYYEGDGYELSAIKMKKATFATKWVFENGEIFLTIIGKSVVIYYTDSVNEAIKDKEKDKTIEDDI